MLEKICSSISNTDTHCYIRVKNSPAFAASHCAYPCRDSQAELTSWLVRWFTRPQTVTHPSTNRARRTVTSLIETNALPLSQIATPVRLNKNLHPPYRSSGSHTDPSWKSSTISQDDLEQSGTFVPSLTMTAMAQKRIHRSILLVFSEHSMHLLES